MSECDLVAVPKRQSESPYRHPQVEALYAASRVGRAFSLSFERRAADRNFKLPFPHRRYSAF